jgi:arylsulfatase A-like enzyme
VHSAVKALAGFVVLFVLWGTVACTSDVEVAHPLLDARHAADVVVEEKVLSRPTSVEQNRLLRGWRYLRVDGALRIVPVGAESAIELSNLEPRPRTLILTVADKGRPDVAPIRARIGDRNLGELTVADAMVTIPLPADLDVGRIAVTLEGPGLEGLTVERVTVSPCLKPGVVEVTPEEVRQSGWSAVDIVRYVPGGSRFVAELEPPSNADPAQSFSVVVDREPGRPREHRVWPRAGSDDRAATTRVSIPLGDGEGLVRVRLLARGVGRPGRWLDARIVSRQANGASPAPPPVPEPPRLVILYVMDALRADHVGHLGPHVELTPELDRLAADGVSFEQHFAVAPNTPPSTRALFSGLSLLDDRQLPHPGPERLAEVFRTAGYRTVSITGNPNLGPNLDLGVGFETVELLRVIEDHHPGHAPTVNRSAEILHEAALDWVDGLAPAERGFLYLHTMNPHNPYTPPPEIEARLAPSGPSTIDGRTRTLTAIRDRRLDVQKADVERIRKLYAAGVAYGDRELGRLLRELSSRFDPGEVLLIVTSDHGEELFEHGGVLHGYTLYDEMLHIPLIMSWPGRIGPRRVTSLTTTVDLHATLLALLGRPSEAVTGRSLWPTALGTEPSSSEPRLTFAAAPGLDGAVMVRSRDWKLIQAPRGGVKRGQGHGRGRSWDLEYLFDVASDPGERHNRAGLDSLEIAWLRSRLLGWLETQRALQPTAGEAPMDAATREQLEALGYIVE